MAIPGSIAGDRNSSLMTGWLTMVAWVGMSVYVGSIYTTTALTMLALYRIVYVHWSDKLGVAVAILQLALYIMPLTWMEGLGWQRFIAWTCESAGRYFPVRVIVEDEDSLKPGRPYVIAYEPHSALPVGIPVVFATHSPLLPKVFQPSAKMGTGLHGMASSVCFAIPIVRQLWWGLGLRPVSRELMGQLLISGKAVVLCPGGVQECLYMQNDGSETVFLRQRHGFVKMALVHGAPLVPVFAFGQSSAFTWRRPGPENFVRWLSRRIGVVPLMIWGRWGSPLPHAVPMTVVIGKAIEVPATAKPSQDQVQVLLDTYIAELQILFHRHKVACGYPSNALLHVL